jgi:hypothetical protein
LSNYVELDAFEIGISWRDVAFKVDGLKKGFNHMTDWTLNQVFEILLISAGCF